MGGEFGSLLWVIKGDELLKGNFLERGGFLQGVLDLGNFVHSIGVIYLSCNVCNGKGKYDYNGILVFVVDWGKVGIWISYVRCDCNKSSVAFLLFNILSTWKLQFLDSLSSFEQLGEVIVSQYFIFHPWAF